MQSTGRERKAGTRGASGARALGSSLIAVVLVACASAGRPPPAPPATLSRVEVAVTNPDARVVGRALPDAVALIDRHGLRLTATTTVEVAPDEASFRASTGQAAPAVLRAWTTFRTITFMPLSTWSDSKGPAVVARLAHELCHAAIYQSFGTEERARGAQIPRFFEEGVCSVVAGQKRMPRDELLARAPAQPFDAALFSNDPDVAYAAAHHALALVEHQRGQGAFARILRAAAEDGAPGCVERALEKEMGVDPPGLWRLVLGS